MSYFSWCISGQLGCRWGYDSYWYCPERCWRLVVEASGARARRGLVGCGLADYKQARGGVGEECAQELVAANALPLRVLTVLGEWRWE